MCSGKPTRVPAIHQMDRIYVAEQIEVPPGLPAVLKAYAKEVIRFNPPNIVSFSKEYGLPKSSKFLVALFVSSVISLP